MVIQGEPSGKGSHSWECEEGTEAMRSWGSQQPARSGAVEHGIWGICIVGSANHYLETNREDRENSVCVAMKRWVHELARAL